MSENENSHVQQTQSAWKKLVDDQVKRVETVTTELNRLEALGVENARTAIDEAAKISRESFTYFSELSAEWRKITLESTRRVAELIAPRG